MIRQFLFWVAGSMDVMRTRHQLERLDAAALADLGLSEADVAAEISRPFWDWEVYDGHHRRRRPASRDARQEAGHAERI